LTSQLSSNMKLFVSVATLCVFSLCAAAPLSEDDKAAIKKQLQFDFDDTNANLVKLNQMIDDLEAVFDGCESELVRQAYEGFDSEVARAQQRAKTMMAQTRASLYGLLNKDDIDAVVQALDEETDALPSIVSSFENNLVSKLEGLEQAIALDPSCQDERKVQQVKRMKNQMNDVISENKNWLQKMREGVDRVKAAAQ